MRLNIPIQARLLQDYYLEAILSHGRHFRITLFGLGKFVRIHPNPSMHYYVSTIHVSQKGF